MPEADLFPIDDIQFYYGFCNVFLQGCYTIRRLLVVVNRGRSLYLKNYNVILFSFSIFSLLMLFALITRETYFLNTSLDEPHFHFFQN